MTFRGFDSRSTSSLRPYVPVNFAALGPALDELLRPLGGAIEDGDGDAVVVEVQDEVLAHDGQADDGKLLRHGCNPSMRFSSL